MKSHKLSSLLLLFLAINWDPVNGLCSLYKQNEARCHDIEDARYIDTYHLHTLRAPSSSKHLTPGNFRNLTSLRHLDLSGGEIEVIDADSFIKLGSLQSVNLANNHLRNLEAGAFDGLVSLHSLKLGKNKIKQLPSALMSLKELKWLDLSGNPLNCNCASLKLRDALVARGVKISKNTYCAEPVSAKSTSILKIDTKTICNFEQQDLQMQGDQPDDGNVHGSGDAEKDNDLDEEIIETAELEKKKEEIPAPPEIIASSTETYKSVESTSEMLVNSTASVKNDITFKDTEDLEKNKSTIQISPQPEETSNASTSGSVTNIQVLSTSEISISPRSPGNTDDEDNLVIPEGSGEIDIEGSGSNESGDSETISLPGPIIYDEKSEEPELLDEEEGSDSSATSVTTTTTEDASVIGAIWSGIWDLVGSDDTTADPTINTTTTTTEKSPEEAIKDEEFISITPRLEDKNEGKPLVSRIAFQNEASDQSPVESQDLKSNNPAVEGAAPDPESSQEAKKGMGSYIVLAALLFILTGLIGFAAYRSDFCRKKKKRGDVERGTEMKDMQKSLLEQNSVQPKVQVSNGNTLENVPLMNSSAVPEEVKEKQRSNEATPAVVINGSNRSNGPSLDVNDPIKPPRKATNHEIEAPLNGLNPPMEPIDGPNGTDLYNGSSEVIDEVDGSPRSPHAQMVKITLQENPDSVPKTPILITRLNGGDNLVKAP